MGEGAGEGGRDLETGGYGPGRRVREIGKEEERGERGRKGGRDEGGKRQ